MKNLILFVLFLSFAFCSIEAQTVKMKKDELFIDGTLVFNVKKNITHTLAYNIVYEAPGRGPVIMAMNHEDPSRERTTLWNGIEVIPSYYVLEFVEFEGKRVEITLRWNYPDYIIKDLLLYSVINTKGEVDVKMLDKYISLNGGCCKFSNPQNSTIIIHK